MLFSYSTVSVIEANTTLQASGLTNLNFCKLYHKIAFSNYFIYVFAVLSYNSFNFDRFQFR